MSATYLARLPGAAVPGAAVSGGERPSVLGRAEETRRYSSSALHAARHFHYARGDAGILALADELQGRPEIPAVAVLDAAGGGALGIVRRDRLFALVGKPFGRDILAKARLAEIVEDAPAFDAHLDLFSVAARILPDGGDYCLLLGRDGRFLGLLAAQDLANYLSRMTQEDIALAGRLQERLMRFGAESRAEEATPAEGPAPRPGIRERGVAAWSRPAKGVGGDFCYSRRLPDGRLFLALCDVSGKGVAASLVVSMVWGMLAMSDLARGLRALLVRVNESIVATFHMETYLTGVFIVFDPGSRRMVLADMGHSHAALLRGGRPYSLKGPRGNLPVGVEAELDPAIYPYRLEEGDELFVYSDGLVEQEDPEGREFGERRLVAELAEAIARGESPREAIPRALDGHRGATPQQDDMSFILLSV